MVTSLPGYAVLLLMLFNHGVVLSYKEFHWGKNIYLLNQFRRIIRIELIAETFF